MVDLYEKLQERARHLGFSLVGAIPARPAGRLEAYLRWIEREMHGLMGYMARPDRVARRRNPALILPGVQTIICLALDYRTIDLPAAIAADPGRGRISNYAWGADYHDIMTPRLEQLAAWLAAQAAGETRHRVYVDTGALLERDHAETAGLGFTGKNTMLIHPRRGSWFFLGEILTTLPFPVSRSPFPVPNSAAISCGRCTRCLRACPTAAFPTPYVLDARRCISYLTIELKGWIPAELRPLMGNWVYGCDVCQDVCPFNRFAPELIDSPFRPDHIDRAAPPLLDLLALTSEGFDARFAGSPIRRIRRERLVRNACVAAGNWGDAAAGPPLTALLADSSPIVRGHAAWALKRVPGDHAAGLAAALSRETDDQVRRELALSA